MCFYFDRLLLYVRHVVSTYRLPSAAVEISSIRPDPLSSAALTSKRTQLTIFHVKIKMKHSKNNLISSLSLLLSSSQVNHMEKYE